jgi:hypothetical protein
MIDWLLRRCYRRSRAQPRCRAAGWLGRGRAGACQWRAVQPPPRARPTKRAFPNQSPVDGHRSFRGAKILPAFSQLTMVCRARVLACGPHSPSPASAAIARPSLRVALSTESQQPFGLDEVTAILASTRSRRGNRPVRAVRCPSPAETDWRRLRFSLAVPRSDSRSDSWPLLRTAARRNPDES